MIDELFDTYAGDNYIKKNIALYNTIENNTIAKNNFLKVIENNYYLLCTHAVFMGKPTASRNGGGGDVSLQRDSLYLSRRWHDRDCNKYNFMQWIDS